MQRWQSCFTSQTINTFWWRFAHIGRMRCSIEIKDYRFQELQLVVSWFSHISIDFHPKKAIEFTITAAVFKWELVQHITAVSKLLWRCRFFYIGDPISTFHCQQRWMEHKEDTGKSLKNALHTLWYAKRHLSGWSDVEQWKIKLVALTAIELR